jgi:hypothetical protein
MSVPAEAMSRRRMPAAVNGGAPCHLSGKSYTERLLVTSSMAA